jgi:Periplasmic glycine betaine/choline-binding (lipo)protein of an ABC-type transport system (osmoprotectant binding protein)
MDRGDGWPSLRRAYNLPQSARGLDHDIAYRGLANGEIDVIDLYSTDAKIEQYDLRVLEDNKDHFPAYEATFLYRRDLATRAPAAITALKRLAGRIPADTMQRLNARSNIDQTDEATVAADFLNQSLGLNATADTDTRAERLRRYTADHLVLVGLSLGLAILFGVPLGIVAAKRRILGPGVLIVVGVIYTIPALALLAMMVPPLGLGRVPAVTALTLYSLLPIVWTTYTGLKGIAGPLRESADALGLRPRRGCGGWSCRWRAGPSWPASRSPSSSTSARPRSGPSSGRAATASPSSPASGGPTWGSSWRARCRPPCSRSSPWRCWRGWSAACCRGRCSRSERRCPTWPRWMPDSTIQVPEG